MSRKYLKYHLVLEFPVERRMHRGGMEKLDSMRLELDVDVIRAEQARALADEMVNGTVHLGKGRIIEVLKK